MNIPKTLSDGRYELVSPLGEGGMSVVYRAFDHRLQVWRAIKILSPQFAAKDGVRNRFEAEAQAMALLEHANIVRVYDVGRDGNWPFIVMELVAGGGLVEWVERHGSMPPKLAIDVILDVCRGVSTAHLNGVIHRDIKPQNLLVTCEGVVRLADFGIARVAQDVSHTKTGAVMGTLGYMAPEQRSDAKNIDERADVYSIAATLYTLLTNRVPTHLFAADRDLAMMKGIDEQLKAVLVRATMYHREERYASVAELVSDFELVRASLPADPADTPALFTPQDNDWSRPKMLNAAERGVLDTNPFGGGDEVGLFGHTILPPSDGDFQGDDEEGSGRFLDQPTLPPDGEERPSDTFIRERRQNQALGLESAYDESDDWTGEFTPRQSSTLWRGWPIMGGIFAALAGVSMLGWALSLSLDRNGPASTPETKVVESGQVTKAVVEPETTPAPEQPAPPVKRVERPSQPKKPVSTVVATPTPAVRPPPPKQCLKKVTAPTVAQVGESVLFVVKLCVPGATDVTLVHRPVDGGAWQTRLMPFTLGALRTKVPVDERYRSGFEYYIRADDLRYGTEARPHRIEIR